MILFDGCSWQEDKEEKEEEEKEEEAVPASR